MAIYPYGQVFNGPIQSAQTFNTLNELNHALSNYADFAQVTFEYLKENGLILPYMDELKSGYLYVNASGELSKHVIYGCFSQLPDRDTAEETEVIARENYARTGKAGTCDQTKLR